MSTDVLTLEQFLALHPWPKAHADKKRLEWFWHFDIALPAAEVWPVVADTSRVNRALGISEMKFEDRQGVRWGTSRPIGVLHEWIEVPWNWVAGEWQESLRLYEHGFSKVVYGAFRLAPISATATRVYVYFGSVPRGLMGTLVLRLGFPPLEKAFKALFDSLPAQPSGKRPALNVLRVGPLPAESEARLATVRATLEALPLDRKCVELLIDWVRSGDEQELHRIQVRERARSWRVDEDQLLRVCLHATRAGLLELSWDAVCPHCRGAAEMNASLGQLTAKADCKVCEIDFATNAEEAVEITFHVHPSIRQIVRRTYCSAEPATKEHIRVQRAVAPGAQVDVIPQLKPGRYRMRLHGEKRYGFLDVGAGQVGQVDWRVSQTQLSHPSTARPTVQFINDSNEERRFILEASQWTDLALRPGRVLSLQDFRDLFSKEYLSADVQLAIGEQTIMFTDMVGSTAMYAERGDPAAFVEVKKHFNEVFAIIAKHRGAVVKTIGDAAMGAFNSPLDAVKAAKEIHEHFHPNRADLASRLRITLNTGPCIAVKLNTGLDYFGHTVNIAAKLQGLAEAWQIAMSEAVYASPGVAQWLSEQNAPLEELAYSSKAIPEPVAVRRWAVFPPQ
jgi:class 3 adenylate cyclase